MKGVARWRSEVQRAWNRVGWRAICTSLPRDTENFLARVGQGSQDIVIFCHDGMIDHKQLPP